MTAQFVSVQIKAISEFIHKVYCKRQERDYCNCWKGTQNIPTRRSANISKVGQKRAFFLLGGIKKDKKNQVWEHNASGNAFPWDQQILTFLKKFLRIGCMLPLTKGRSVFRVL